MEGSLIIGLETFRGTKPEGAALCTMIVRFLEDNSFSFVVDFLALYFADLDIAGVKSSCGA